MAFLPSSLHQILPFSYHPQSCSSLHPSTSTRPPAAPLPPTAQHQIRSLERSCSDPYSIAGQCAAPLSRSSKQSWYPQLRCRWLTSMVTWTTAVDDEGQREEDGSGVDEEGRQEVSGQFEEVRWEVDDQVDGEGRGRYLGGEDSSQEQHRDMGRCGMWQGDRVARSRQFSPHKLLQLPPPRKSAASSNIDGYPQLRRAPVELLLPISSWLSS
uniref:Uncharacterized protein n=1 Tax=Arundo donax TaxID=35708 RepID=A0A0A9GEB1_ARUDO